MGEWPSEFMGLVLEATELGLVTSVVEGFSAENFDACCKLVCTFKFARRFRHWSLGVRKIVQGRTTQLCVFTNFYFVVCSIKLRLQL